MEKQIEAMRGTISALKQKKEKPPKKVARQQPTPAATSSTKPAKAEKPIKPAVIDNGHASASC